MTDQFFITGMFRSGTTLIARMLQTHSQIACASDPYFEIFKEFRNETLRTSTENFDNINTDQPLDDYYFDRISQKHFRMLQNQDLSLKLDSSRLPELRNRIQNASKPYSPKLARQVENLQGKRFSEFLSQGFDLIRDAYGDPKTDCIGFKEVWTGEFAKHLLEEFQNVKVVHVIRDPRAVTASNYVSGDRYPFLFLSRQWRKLASLSIRDNLIYEDQRVKILQYEELIQHPKKNIFELCEFLSVPFEEVLLDPANFRDGDGEPWNQNTNYNEGKSKFNTNAIDRWKNSLSHRQKLFIECLCHFEMSHFEYSHSSIDKLFPDDFFPNVPTVEEKKLADWIRPHVSLGQDQLRREYALEKLRFESLLNPSSISPGFRSNLVLSEKIWNTVTDELS